MIPAAIASSTDVPGPLPTSAGGVQVVTSSGRVTGVTPAPGVASPNATGPIVMACAANHRLNVSGKSVAAYVIVNSCTENGTPVPFSATSHIDLFIFDRNEKIYLPIGAGNSSSDPSGFALMSIGCSTPSTFKSSGWWYAILPDGVIGRPNTNFADGPVGC
jgi:hypothetical protein